MTDRTFDPKASYVMGRFATVLGHGLNAGQAITIIEGADGSTAGQMDEPTARALFNRGAIVLPEEHKPTPVETPEQEAQRVVTIEPTGNAWFLIRAPWLEQGEKVHGEEAATARYREVVAAGRPADAPAHPNDATGPAAMLVEPSTSDTFTLAETGSNGYFEITGPGLAEPEKVRGKSAADARVAELQASFEAQQGIMATAEVPLKED